MAAVTADGHLYSWGEGDGCGFEGGGMQSRPKLVLVETEDGSTPLAKVETVSCGTYHTAVTTTGACARNVGSVYGMRVTHFLIADGALYTFGKGRYRALGHGNSADQELPKKVREPHSVCAPQIYGCA